MNLRVLTVCMAGILSAGLACCPAGAEEGAKPPPKINVSSKVFREPPVDLASKRLYVEFDDSPKLSGMFRETLGKRGYIMATSAEESDVQIRFIGYAAVGLFKTKPSKMKFAEFIEKASIKPPGKEEAEVGNRSLVDVVAMDAAARHLAPSIRGTLSATNLGEWIGDVTGMRGAFNKAVTGDPRGFSMHENCSKYQQNVVVGATGSVSWMVTMTTLSEEIVLDRMVDESLERLLEPLPVK